MSMPRPVLPVFEFETPADDATPPRSDGPQEGSTHVIRRTFEPRQSDELVVFSGDWVRINVVYDDGWGLGIILDRGSPPPLGVLPLDILGPAIPYPVSRRSPDPPAWATIDAIPPECLILIFDHVFAHGHGEGTPGLDTSLRTLAMASRVARNWRGPAQARLWKELCIKRWWEAERLAKSPVCGQFRTSKIIWSFPLREGTEEKAGQLLASLRGLEWVEVNDYNAPTGTRFNAGWLSFPSLANLTTLSVDVAFEGVAPTELHPPFHLRELELGRSTSYPSIINSLFTSSASSLLSLTLVTTHIDEAFERALLGSLPLLAHQLTSLTLHGPVRGLGPVLSRFSALSYIFMYIYALPELANVDALLASLHPPIESLGLFVRCPLDYAELRARIMGNKAWVGLYRVDVQESREELEGSKDGKEWVKLCVERGIEVSHDPRE